MSLSTFPRPQCLPPPLRTCRVFAPRSFRRCITTSVTLPAQVLDPESSLLKSPLQASSLHHDSLETFLAHSARTRTRTWTTVWVGTHYEYTAAKYLQRLGFSLVRTGGANDSGIDLIGYWVLPELPAPIPVILQCKARSRPCSIGPSHARELQGAFQGVPHGWSTQDVPVMALLVVSGKPSRGTIEFLASVRRPMGFINMTTGGIIEQIVWNRAARVKLLEGVGVTLRHTPRDLLTEEELLMDQGPQGLSGDQVQRTEKKKLEGSSGTGIRKDIQLTWMGLPIFPDRGEMERATSRLVGDLGADKGQQSTSTAVSDVPTEAGIDRTVASVDANVPEVELAIPTSHCSVLEASPAGTKKRGRGRPPGSKNKPRADSAQSAVKAAMKEVKNRGGLAVLPVSKSVGECKRQQERRRSLNWKTLHDMAIQGAVDSPHCGLRDMAAIRGETAYDLSVSFMQSFQRSSRPRRAR